jgi:predicted Zn-dependent protease
MTTRQLLSVIGDGRKRAVVVSHFYQKGSDVFAFHGLSSEGSYADMSDLMQGPATGFSAMTNQTRLNPQPKRIVVKSVARSASLEKVLRTMNVERGLWAKTAWLNGRQLSDVLMAGEQLKVIQ